MTGKQLGRLLVLVASIALFLAACGADPTATPEPTATPLTPAEPTPTLDAAGLFQVEWDALIAAAQAEGEVATFGFDRPLREGLLAVFEEQFGITVINSDGSGRQQSERTLAEREVGKYTLDVWIGGIGTPNKILIPAGALAPIRSVLIHPEVLDESAWIGGEILFLDPGREFIFGYAGAAEQDSITYNTDLVKGDEITSFWDLLDPRWKGKIVANDPRSGGSTPHTIFFFVHPDLGPEFLTRLLSETDITFSPDRRTSAEWLASGQYSLCLWSCASEVEAARKDGLPVQELWPTTLKEGGDIRVGNGGFLALDTPANPNAQKLFTNWFLSKEGQILYQKATENNSLRIDIPKDDVPLPEHLDPGTDYAFFALDPDFNTKERAAFELVGRVLAEAGR